MKIFVSSFPPKTAYKNGLNIDLYQLTKIIYTEAKLVTEVDEETLNSDGVSGPECGSSILGCDEAPIAPPPECGEKGPPGPPGLPGPPGPGAVCNPCPPGTCEDAPRTFCGYLPGPPPPPTEWLFPECLYDMGGYIVKRASQVFNQGNPANLYTRFTYPDNADERMQCSAGNPGVGVAEIRVPEDATAGPNGSLHFNPVFVRGEFQGVPSFRSQVTLGEWLDGSLPAGCQLGAAGSSTGNVFMPSSDPTGVVVNGDYVKWTAWAELFAHMVSNDGPPPEGSNAAELADQIIDQYEPCAEGNTPPPPPPADQGDQICPKDDPDNPDPDPPPGESDEDCGGGGCPNPIDTCDEEFREGDTFIDARNGITYFFLDGKWQKNGVRNCGTNDCGGGCPPPEGPCPTCRFKITCFCNPPSCPPNGGGGCECDKETSDGGCIGSECGNGGTLVCSDNCPPCPEPCPPGQSIICGPCPPCSPPSSGLFVGDLF